jgi:hypothetical protein
MTLMQAHSNKSGQGFREVAMMPKAGGGLLDESEDYL